jgi:DNA-binding NarL/FixJ family response regulator
VLTDHERREFRSLAATFGARAFLHKGTEFDRLVEVLRPLVGLRAPTPRRH